MNTENQQTEQTVPAEKKELEITQEISHELHQAGKWSKFLAILGFVAMGFMIVAGIGMSIVSAFIPSNSTGMMPFPLVMIGVMYLIFAAIYFFPVLYLYRFSTSIRQALFSNNQERLSNAFRNLKAHYRFIGILTIVMFCLYPIFIIIMMIVGFSGMSNFPGMNA